MRNDIIRGVLLGFLLLGFTVPGIALAGGGEKGCSNYGTWFGVEGPGDTRLTGWMANIMGKSADEGTNDLEYPNFDVTLDNSFPHAVALSSMRGIWRRTGGKTFDYAFTGYATDEFGAPVYIATVSGVVTLQKDCRYEYITATMDVFLAGMSPFEDDPVVSFELEPLWAYKMAFDD
jgi:hypothetical protein